MNENDQLSEAPETLLQDTSLASQKRQGINYSSNETSQKEMLIPDNQTLEHVSYRAD